MTPENPPAPLHGRRIGVPESRQLDLFAQMLENRGAEVLRCPLVDIRDTPDTAAVEAWIDDVLANGLDDMIWLTGEGLRRIKGFAERGAGERYHALMARIGNARNITRGPKPVRELRALSLRSDISATQPTTAGVVEALQSEDLQGRRVGVQLYGGDPNRPLMGFLAERGATALAVAPYVYADEAQDPQVRRFIDAIVNHDMDALAFTSSPQVKRLYKVARTDGRQEELTAAMNRLCVASIGPLVRDRLAAQGVTTTLMPANSYFMKPLVRQLVAHFSE